MIDNQSNETPWYGKTVNTDQFIKNMMPSTSGDFFTKSYDAETFFKKLISNITDKPFWVKQAVFLELRDDIKRMTNVELLEAIDKNDLLQLYVPKLSILGSKVFQDEGYARSLCLNNNVVNLLKYIDSEKNVIDICYSTNMTLKQFSLLILDAEEMGLIDPMRSTQIINVFQYIADQLDIGQLLLKLGKITPDQLTNASFTLAESQKAYISDDETSLEDVLIRLNYVTKYQLNSLLVLKEASEVVFDGQSPTMCSDIDILQENIDMLAYEKQYLQGQLDEIKPLIDTKNRKIAELQKEVNYLKEELEKYQKQAKGGFFNKI